MIFRLVNEFYEIVKDYYWFERNIKDKGVWEMLYGL